MYYFCDLMVKHGFTARVGKKNSLIHETKLPNFEPFDYFGIEKKSHKETGIVDLGKIASSLGSFRLDQVVY